MMPLSSNNETTDNRWEATMDAETRRRRWYDGSARRSMAEISVRRTNWSPRATSRVNCLCRRELAVIITCTNDPRITEDQVTDPRTRALGRWLCSVEKGFVSTTLPESEANWENTRVFGEAGEPVATQREGFG
jgi:hypothetical protein